MSRRPSVEPSYVEAHRLAAEVAAALGRPKPRVLRLVWRVDATIERALVAVGERLLRLRRG